MGSVGERRARLISVPRPALVMYATVRARLRASELGLTALAVGVGVLAGLCVAVMTTLVNVAHMLIYGIPFDVRLSAAERVAPLAAFGAPMLGGLAARRDRPLARSQEGAARGRSRRGQRLARRAHVASPRAYSSRPRPCCRTARGASVGLEAGYAQIGAGLASYLGVKSRLRRQDLGCWSDAGPAARSRRRSARR